MTTRQLIKLLRDIMAVHPEAADAEIWVKRGDSGMHPTSVGFDCKHRPFRIKLEE